MITSKIIADSITPDAIRITTFELTYPRFIHAEFMTHRAFSRNASSSRAIPIKKQIELIRNSTAIPIHWGKAQAGMQAENECNSMVELDIFVTDDGINYTKEVQSFTREDAWFHARDNAITVAKGYLDAGYHKQVVNRLLEPFSHITVVVTATSYDNFFALRYHHMAQPEINDLAEKMYNDISDSVPTLLSKNEWHLPYVTDADREVVKNKITMNGVLRVVPTTQQINSALIKLSVARCARTSYLNHDKSDPDYDKDIALHDQLVVSEPLHASPAEHQVKADVWVEAHNPYESKGHWQNEKMGGNLGSGVIQYRKTLANECIIEFVNTA